MTWKKPSIWDSNKRGHRFAAALVGVGIATCGIATQNYYLVATGLTIPVYERFCTPDMDHNSRHSNTLWLKYWAPFKWMTPHRSRWSHSLLLGTPLRFAYAAFPFAIALGFWVALDPVVGAILAANPWAWAQLFSWIPLAAIISDTVHLLKDGFGPIELFFGK